MISGLKMMIYDDVDNDNGDGVLTNYLVLTNLNNFGFNFYHKKLFWRVSI